jgi:hypothetical protein
VGKARQQEVCVCGQCGTAAGACVGRAGTGGGSRRRAKPAGWHGRGPVGATRCCGAARASGWQHPAAAARGSSARASQSHPTLQTKVPPNTYFMAAASSASYPTSSSAGRALSPARRLAAAAAGAGMPRPPTLFRGMMVTRWRSCPRASSALAVASLSTTTWYNLPPAATSSAVAVAGSATRASRATTPFTRLRSKPRSGSA